MDLKDDKYDALYKLPDIELIKLYKKEADPIYVSILLDKYKYFILKVLSRWNASNTHRVKLNKTDFEDAHQYAKMAVMLFMQNVKDVDKVKNVSVSIKSYIYTTLNKYYRYQKYETFTGIVTDNIGSVEQEPTIEKNLNRDRHVLLYYKYVCEYDYYKLGLMLTKSRDRNTMRVGVFKMIKSQIDKLR